jgi:hypothetical protein
LLYRTLVRPILEYGNVSWCLITKEDSDALERIQRRATRMICGLTNMEYPQRLQVLNIPTLLFRRHRGDMIEIYKYLHHLQENPGNILELDNNNRTRGHSFKLMKPRSYE